MLYSQDPEAVREDRKAIVTIVIVVVLLFGGTITHAVWSRTNLEKMVGQRVLIKAAQLRGSITETEGTIVIAYHDRVQIKYKDEDGYLRTDYFSHNQFTLVEPKKETKPAEEKDGNLAKEAS